MNELHPIGHGERRYDGPAYVVFNLSRIPPGNNGVVTVWRGGWISRLRFLVFGRLYVWFAESSHPRMVVNTAPIGKWVDPDKAEESRDE
uniref:Uncharacterized protein n=1 Tax=viral metagenome TaxID=1070528 RepID=A0A6M3IGU4_9ZZZZ